MSAALVRVYAHKDLEDKCAITCLHKVLKHFEQDNGCASELYKNTLVQTDNDDRPFIHFQSRLPRYSDFMTNFCLQYHTKSYGSLDICMQKPSFLTMLLTIDSYVLTGGGRIVDQFSGPALFAFYSLYSDISKHENVYKHANILSLPLFNGIIPLLLTYLHDISHSITLSRVCEKTVDLHHSQCVHKELQFCLQFVVGIPEIVLQYLANTDRTSFFELSTKAIFLNTDIRNEILKSASNRHTTLLLNKAVSHQKTLTNEMRRISVDIESTSHSVNQFWFYIVGKRKAISCDTSFDTTIRASLQDNMKCGSLQDPTFEMFDVLDTVIESSTLSMQNIEYFSYTAQNSKFTDKFVYGYPIQPKAVVHTMTFTNHCDPENGQELKQQLNSSCNMQKFGKATLSITFSADAVEDLFSLYDDITLHYGLFFTSKLIYEDHMMMKSE